MEITLAVKSPIMQAVEAVGLISYRELKKDPIDEKSIVKTDVILIPFRGAYRESNPS